MKTSSKKATSGFSTKSSTKIPPSEPSSSVADSTSTISQPSEPPKASSPDNGYSRTKDLILNTLRAWPTSSRPSATNASQTKIAPSPLRPHSPSFKPPQNPASPRS